MWWMNYGDTNEYENGKVISMFVGIVIANKMNKYLRVFSVNRNWMEIGVSINCFRVVRSMREYMRVKSHFIYKFRFTFNN